MSKAPDDIFDTEPVEETTAEALERKTAPIPSKELKIEAIKGLPMELSQEQLAFLKQKTPPEFIKTRPGANGMTFPYVEVGYVTHMLNMLFGFNWDFLIEDQVVGKKQIWVRGKLVVRAGDREITKSQYGGAEVKYPALYENGKYVGSDYERGAIDIANDLKAAASDCLKKCASMIGIANDIYWKGSNNV